LSSAAMIKAHGVVVIVDAGYEDALRKIAAAANVTYEELKELAERMIAVDMPNAFPSGWSFEIPAWLGQMWQHDHSLYRRWELEQEKHRIDRNRRSLHAQRVSRFNRNINRFSGRSSHVGMYQDRQRVARQKRIRRFQRL
jgi:hypothetical protein